MNGKKGLAKTKEESKALAALNYGEHEGGGFENQTREDVSIPFISVLQGLSPQVESIAAAKPGMLFNTVTEELMQELLFVPATTQHVYVEWIPRDAGGGFVAIHSLEDPVVKAAKESATEFGKLVLPSKNELIETFYVYGVTCNETESTGLAVIAFTSTKIKVYKRYNTRLQTFMLKMPDGRKVRPPLFAHLTKLGTVKEKNNQGEYYNFTLAPAGESLMDSLLKPEDPRYVAALECKQLVDAGLGKPVYADTEPGEDGEGKKKPLPF